MRTREAIRDHLSDHQALLCTLVGEALNEPIEGLLAVVSTIRNRVIADLHGDHKPDWWGEGYVGVCLKKWQFSCWWETNTNSERVYTLAETLMDGGVLTARIEALSLLAQLAIDGHIPDYANGADHYLTQSLLRSSAKPAWVKNQTPVKLAGNHAFFHLQS